MGKFNRYGWRPDVPDARDRLFAAKPEHIAARPPSFDLRPKMPPVYDQGDLGSCTANASGAAVQYLHEKEGKPYPVPSRLFIYYNTRALEGTTRYDAGGQIRDAIKALNTQGAPPETDWAYIIQKFAQKPPQKAYSDGASHKILTYQRVVQLAEQIESAISQGYPVVIGFTVYTSFESQQVAQTGIVPMPNFKTEKVLGGHAVLIVGYDSAKQMFTVRNSWGAGWGDKGYFHVPYAYFLCAQLADDLWTIQFEA